MKTGILSVGGWCRTCVKHKPAKAACEMCEETRDTRKVSVGDKTGRVCSECRPKWKIARNEPTLQIPCVGPRLQEFADSVAVCVEVHFYCVSFPIADEGYTRRQKKKWCLIILIRVVLWRRFGILCGVLATPPSEAYADAEAIADFFAAQTWPSHACTVLLLGLRSQVATLGPIKAALNAKGHQSRAEKLKGTKLSGSQRNLMTGMNVADFVKNPRDYDGTPIVKQAARLAVSSGMVQNMKIAMSCVPKPLTNTTFARICYP